MSDKFDEYKPPKLAGDKWDKTFETLKTYEIGASFRVRDFARDAGLGISTAYRLISTLALRGDLERTFTFDPSNRRRIALYARKV